MQRCFVVCLLAAACGDNLEVEEPTTVESIAAVCDEGQLDQLVAKLPNVLSARSAECGDFVEQPAKCYEVVISQPVNHRDPGGATFKQHLFVTHRGCDRPTVIADWGYSWNLFYDDELA